MQCAHDKQGSVYRTGASGVVVDDSLDGGSVAAGYEVERGKGGVDTMGSVPLLEERGSPARVGSVVHREEGG